MNRSSFAFAVFVLATAAFAAPRQQRDDFRRIEPGEEIVFPRDHGAHPETRIEWWYLTGNLEDETGRRYGMQFTVFRSALTAAPPEPDESPLRARQVYAGHLALTDVASGETRFAERLRRGGTPLAFASESDLDVVLEDWSLDRADDDTLSLDAGAPAEGFAWDLEFVPRKSLVLHGDAGVSSKGAEPGNASVYVSWTRLRTTGTLTIDGEDRAVSGTSWFDHEYGSSVLGAGVAGWDWFGLQLDDGRELMLFHLRRGDGPPASASSGTLVRADGTVVKLGLDDFELARAGAWTSPRTDATYPSGWTLRLPRHDVDVTLTPLVRDCELSTDTSTGVVYWEGPVEIAGSATGRGYAELTGYAGTMEGRF